MNSSEKYYSRSGLPPEIVMHLLRLMRPETVTKCRQVCKQWKNIIDDFLFFEESYWQKECFRKFGNDYLDANRKKLKKMNSADLYKSLSLWEKLYDAESVVTYEKLRSDLDFVGLKVMANGTVGVQTQQTIQYYSSFTKRVQRRNIYGRPSLGRYLRYAENSHIMALLTTESSVIGSLKMYESVFGPKILVKGAQDFMLFDESLYIIDLENRLFLIRVDKNHQKFVQTFVFTSPESIRCWGAKEGIFHFITTCNQLFRVENACAVQVPAGVVDLNMYVEFGFLNNSLMSLRNSWPSYVSHLRGACTVFSYCGVIFLGSRQGTLDIHRVHKSRGGGLGPVILSFNLFPPHYHQQQLYPIVAIDVVEQYYGHRVMVLTPSQLYTIEINNYYGDRRIITRRRNQINVESVNDS